MDVGSIACGPYQIHHNYYKDCTHNNHGRFKLECTVVRYDIIMVFVVSFKHLYNIMSFSGCQNTDTIVGVMVSMIASGAVDFEFEPPVGSNQRQEQLYLLNSGESKDWLARNQDNVSE